MSFLDTCEGTFEYQVQPVAWGQFTAQEMVAGLQEAYDAYVSQATPNEEIETWPDILDALWVHLDEAEKRLGVAFADIRNELRKVAAGEPLEEETA